MKREFPLVPTSAFHKVVKSYAFERGKPVFTWDHYLKALTNYIAFASQRN